jgi:hypothetical protein
MDLDWLIHRKIYKLCLVNLFSCALLYKGKVNVSIFFYKNLDITYFISIIKITIPYNLPKETMPELSQSNSIQKIYNEKLLSLGISNSDIFLSESSTHYKRVSLAQKI